MIDEDWYWPGLAEERLGIRVGFSGYLFDLARDSGVRGKLEEELKGDVKAAMAEALLIDDDNVNWTVDIEQVGPTAQEFNQVFVWLDSLPKDVVTGLVVVGVERSLAAVYGWVKHRLESKRREVGDVEVTATLQFHSSTLAELCKEHVVREYGATIQSVDVWIKKSEGLSHSAPAAPAIETPFLIVVSSDRSEFSYVVKPDASVIDFRVDGATAPLPKLIPDVPIPFDDSVPLAIPQGFDWPSQDMVDRSEHIAILAGGRSDPIMADEFTKPFLEKATREAVAAVLPDLDPETLRAEDHEIGPAAGAVEDFVVTLFENRESILLGLSAAADAWAIYEIVSRVRDKLRSSEARQQNKGQDIRFFLPAGTLAIICEEYIRRHFHPRAHLTTEWYCLSREFYGGYISPGHPNPNIEYLIIVSTSRESYRFRVLGSGEVMSFSVRRGRLDAELPTPDLFDSNATKDNADVDKQQ